jgi:GT2 family glycosyltransferase
MSIIVLTYNNQELTKLCLDSIYSYSQYPSFELIVVDNASNDGTPEYLKNFANQHQNVRLILNSDNKGFAAGNNQAAQIATGKFLVFLNNDTVVSQGWLWGLYQHLARDPKIGMVGPVTNNIANEARVQVDYTYTDHTDLNIKDVIMEGHQRAARYFHEAFEIKTLALYCAMISADLYKKLDGLDERYRVGMFEDGDLAMKIKQAGYKLVCARDVFIHHFSGASFFKLGDEYYRIFEENKKKFEEKWGIEWQQHRQGSEFNNFRDELAKLLQQNIRDVVVVAPNLGWETPVFQRPQQMALAFGRQNCLTIFCEWPLSQSAGFIQVAPLVSRYQGPFDTLFEHDWNPLVVVYSYNTDFAQEFKSPHRVLYEYIDDLDVFPYDQDELAAAHKYWVHNADLVIATAKDLYEEVAVDRSDVLLNANAVDYGHFSRTRDNTFKVPMDMQPLVAKKSPIIGYYGALARWFDYSLFKEIARLRPDYQFVLIGPDSDNTLLPSGVTTIPNVFWLGPKEYNDLPDYLGCINVTIIPFVVNEITHATSPLKLFEYLAGHKPVVITPMRESMLTPGVLVGGSAQEFVQRLDEALQLSDDPEFIALADSVALANTWDERAKQILNTLAQKKSAEK